MNKTNYLFLFVCLIIVCDNIDSYSQPASRSVGQRAVPRIGSDDRDDRMGGYLVVR